MELRNWDWLAEALAEEMASASPNDVDLILARLRARLGYASADVEFDGAARSDQARIELVDRIANRIEARRPRSGQPSLHIVGAEDEAA